jgi:hydrogenase-4 membrane subunit HyfE
VTETLIFALGLGVVVVRRRSLAIGLVAAQSLTLGLLALGSAEELAVPGIVLIVKAVAIPALLGAVVHRTREPRLVAAAAGPLARLAATAAVAGAAAALLPALGTGDVHAERTAVAVVVCGLAIVVARRPVLFQLLGLVVAENGLSLLAISVPGGLSWVIELGALLDLALIVVVASFFARRIHSELGTSDTHLLRGLRD